MGNGIQAGAANFKLMADITDLQRQMAQVQQLMDSTGQKVTGAFAGVGGRIMAALAPAAILGALAAIVRGSADAMGAMHDLSIQTGETVENLSALVAIGKYTETGADTIGGAMGRMAKNLAGANEESLGTGMAIQALGLNLEEFRRLGPADQMQLVAKAMNGYADSADKSAIAQALWGKEGARLLPFIKDLALTQGLQAKITTEQAAQADEFGDNLVRLRGSSEAWRKELAAGMIPALDEGLRAFIDVQNGSDGLRGSIRDLSKDGSITEWTRNTIMAVTYVIDAFSGIGRVVRSLGNVIAGFAAAVANRFINIGDVISKALSGNLTAAIQEFEAGGLRQKAIWDSVGETLQDLWTQQSLGQQLRDRMDQMRALGPQDAAGAKPGLDFKNSRTGTGASDNVNRYIAEIEALKVWNDTFNDFIKLTRSTEAETLGLNKAQERLIQYLTSPAYEMHTEELRQVILEQAYAAIGAEEHARAQKEAAKAQKEAAKAIEEARRINERLVEGYVKSADSAAQRVEALRDEAAAADLAASSGMSLAQAVEAVHIAKLQEQQTQLLGNEEAVIAIQREIDKRRELQQLIGTKEQGQAILSVFRSIDQTAHSVFTNVFEGGANIFRKLGDVLKSSLLDVLYQLTVRKFVVQLTAAVTGGSAASIASAAGVGGSVGMGGIGGALGSMGSGFGLGLQSTMQNGFMNFGANFSNIGAMVEGGSYAQALGSASPYIAAAVAAIKVLSSLQGGETRSGGQYAGTNLLAAPSGGQIDAANITSAIGATQGSINAYLARLGSSTRLSEFFSGLETSSNGKGFAYAGGALSTGAVFGQGQNGLGYLNRRGNFDAAGAVTAFGEELSQSVLQALQADLDHLPDYVRKYLDGIDVDAMGKDAADKLLASIDAVATQRATLEQQIYELTTSDAQKLIDARIKERAAIDATNIAQYERLIALQDEQRATAAATVAAQERARIEEQLANQRSNLQTQLYQLTGNTAALRADVLAALGGDQQSIDLQRQIWAMQDAQQAASVSAASYATAVTYAGEAMDNFGDSIAAYLRKLGMGQATALARTSMAGAAQQYQQQLLLAGQGNASARSSLTDYADAYIGAVSSQASSAMEVTRARAFVNADLSRFVTDPNAGLTASMRQMAAEMAALRSEVVKLRAESQATAISTRRTADVLDRVTQFGDAMLTEASA